MIKLQTFANSPTSKTLLNNLGRLSFCPECCCPDLPALLCLHVVPTGLDAFGAEDENCVETDERNVDDFIMTGDFPPGSTNCENWWTFNNDEGKNAQPCWDGHRGDIFGVGVHLYCVPISQFRFDVCFMRSGQPDFPDSTGQCQPELFVDQEPDAVNACNADPGEFYIDLGKWIPQRGRVVDGAAPDDTVNSCACQFHLYIDEVCGNSGPLQEQNPNYYYPAEGIGGHPGQLEGMDWFFEEYPGVGTPEHPKRPPRLAKTPCPGVGRRIGRKASKAGFKYKQNGGCQCNELMNEMNKAGPQQILENLDFWTARMKASANQWFKVQRGPAGVMKRAIKPIAMVAIRNLIKKSCEEELRCLQR